MIEKLIEKLMDRFRGTPGILGRIVLWVDVRWLKKVANDLRRA